MTERENHFTAALLDPGQPAPKGLTDGFGRPPGCRFDVYRNNVTVSLIEALETGFPTVASLLGIENMKGLARLYLRANPPGSPLMMHYGETFPAFLATREELSHLGYLPDMARLDLALRRSYHAADAAPVDPSEFSMAPEALMQATITLAPSLGLIRSDWPVHDIWRHTTEANAPKPRAVAQDIVILRPEFDPLPHLLAPGAAAWLDSLRQGQTLGEAFDTALAEAPQFDLGSALALLLDGRAISSQMTDEQKS